MSLLRVFFFSSRRRHTRWPRDWSSDVCSSDLKPRKRRDDAGTTALTLEEARIISGYLMESCRANGKRLASIENALEVLRSNNMVRAERVDISTGEVLPLSVSAVSRGLTRHGLHPDQLNQRSEEHTSELQSRGHLVCRLLLEK